MREEYWTYFDEAWKKVIERFFPRFLRFFVPELHEEIESSKPFVFLDKEMERLAQQDIKGSKFVDRHVQVHFKGGMGKLMQYDREALEKDKILWIWLSWQLKNVSDIGG